MSSWDDTPHQITSIDTMVDLDRNTVVANIISILLNLRTQWLPEEVQQFVTGWIDNTDNESLLKILASLSTKQAKRFYSHYIVPADDLIALEAEYYNDDAEVEEMDPDERITSDDPDEVAQVLEKNYDRTSSWRCYYRLVVESWRKETKYDGIPYCLSERDVVELANVLNKNPWEYMSTHLQVWTFLEYVINKWGEYLVQNTTWKHQARAMKLIGRK